MSADLVFVGGTVVTVDDRFSTAEALAVEDGRIAAVGSESDVRGLVGPGTRVVELSGGAVLPGINDSHIHMAMLGAYWPSLWMDAMATGGAFPTPRELATDDDRRAAIRRATELLLALGITSVTEPGLGPGANGQHGDACGAAVLETYRAMAAEGELLLRVTALALFGELDGPTELAAYEAGVEGLGAGPEDGEWFRLAGVKIFADGIPPMQSAWMREPYPDGSHGALMTPGGDDDERVRILGEMVRRAHDAGWQVGVHATGSAAIAAVVDAFVAAGDRRHYVIHGDTAPAETIATMARHGIGLNAQPSLYPNIAPMLAGTLGEEGAANAFALRDALDAGVPLCLSSDSPVIAPDWRRGIADAVTREGPQQLTLEQAIRAYTIAGARQDHAEAWKGSLEVGKVADLCVLAENPLEVPPAELPDVQVTHTMVAGEVVFQA